MATISKHRFKLINFSLKNDQENWASEQSHYYPFFSAYFTLPQTVWHDLSPFFTKFEHFERWPFWAAFRDYLTSRTLGAYCGGLASGSSELNTFPENVVIFFAQIIIYHMLITGNKKLCGVFGWNIALEWGRKWALKRKNSRKNILVFSSLAESAMNWCLVAVFFLIGIGFICKKTSGRHSRDCLEEYRGVFVIN